MGLLGYFLLKRDSNTDIYQQSRKVLTSWSPKPTGRCYKKSTENTIYDLQVVIPAYNVESYIEKCLNSLKPLLFSNYKVLIQIVDDGSTDRTGEIADEFAKETVGNITVFHHQNNKGLAAARNTALSTLYGNYVLMIDSDDYLPDGFSIDNLMKAVGDFDILQGYCSTVNRNGRIIEGAKKANGYAWGKLFHHRVFDSFQFPEGYWFEDTPVKFILYNMGFRIRSIDESVYCYRKNPNGITATAEALPKAVDTYWVTELCLEEMPVFGIEYNQNTLDCLLQQTILNMKRVRKQPLNVRKAIFTLTKELIEKYFSDIQSSTYIKLERAIRRRQFLQFEFHMYLSFLRAKLSI